jgi:hypothetical protein
VIGCLLVIVITGLVLGCPVACGVDRRSDRGGLVAAYPPVGPVRLGDVDAHRLTPQLPHLPTEQGRLGVERVHQFAGGDELPFLDFLA